MELVDWSLLPPIDPYWSIVVLLPGIYATLFRIFGKGRPSLILLWMAAVVGYLLGQVLADRGFVLFTIRMGSSQIVESSLVAWMVMLFANRLRL